MSEPKRCPDCGRVESDEPSIEVCPDCHCELTTVGTTTRDPEETFEAASPGWERTPDPYTIRPESGAPTNPVDHAPDEEATLPQGRTKPAHRASRFADSLTPPGYEILGTLGRGGMGVVYKARQAGLNRLVALKMLRNEAGARPDQLERFRIEAEAVARLRHPNVVQVYEVGEVGGLPYLSLELLEGGSLLDKIAGLPQAPEPAADLMATLALAVHAAHIVGIVHRDIKPQNVLFDRDGVPKITDFGLAKRLEVEHGLTMTNEVMGTLSFMAPEQALGQNRQVGPPADIYALGATLYVMLTGRPPIQGTSWRETLLMIVEQEPVPPSKLQPKIPRDLETICLKCLAKEPQKRYGSAETLADDLRRFLDGHPILARRTPAWERGWKWARRHPTSSSLAALGLAGSLVLAMAVVRYVGASRIEARKVEAQIARMRQDATDDLLKGEEQRAGGRPNEAQVALAQLAERIQGEPRLDDLRRRVATVLEKIRIDLEARARAETDRLRLIRFEKLRDDAQFEDTPSVDVDLGIVLKPGGGPGRAREAARAALSTFGSFDPGGEWTMAPSPASFSAREREDVVSGSYQSLMVLAEAVAHPLSGEDSRRQGAEALRVLDRTESLRAPSRAYRIRRSSYLKQSGDEEGARRERARAEHLETSGAFDHFLLGQELLREGDHRGALRQFEAAIQEQPDLFWAQCLSAIAYLNSQPPRPAEARAALNACLRQKKEDGLLYLLRGSAAGQLGVQDLAASAKSETTRATADDYFAAAEDDFRKALDLGLDPGFRYALFMNRGAQRFQRGLLNEGVADFQQAVALDPSRYNAYLSLAQVLARLDRRSEAITQLDLAIQRKPDLAVLYRQRALLRIARDGSPASIEAAVADLDEAIRREPARSRDAANDLALRGNLLSRIGRAREALEACDAALAIVPDLAGAHRDRVKALLDLERFDEVIGSCDAAIARGGPSADLHELRGLARVGRNSFASAIDDFSKALAIQPKRGRTHAYRGWAYLFANAAELALYDFEEAIRLDPSDPDGFAGRAAARVRLRDLRPAVADVEEALRLGGDPSARRLYNAARTYAQAATVALGGTENRGRAALREAVTYQTRAASLLAQALEKTPADRRSAFYRDVIEPDTALTTLRKRYRLAPTGPVR